MGLVCEECPLSLSPFLGARDPKGLKNKHSELLRMVPLTSQIVT